MFFLLLLPVLAGAVLLQHRLLSAVILLGVFSLASSMICFLIGAPDVAVTEGAIGVAFVTFIYVLALSDQGKLHVITEEIPPFFYQEKSEIQGIEYEILEELADESNLDLEVEFVTHSDLTSRVSGLRDEILAGAFYQEYLSTLNLPTTNTYHQGSLAKIEDQKGTQRIGILADMELKLVKNLQAKNVLRFNSLQDLVNAYNRQKISCFVADSARMSIALNRINATRKKSSEVTQIGEIDYTFAVSSSEIELQSQLNDLLQSMESSGKLEQILNRYLR